MLSLLLSRAASSLALTPALTVDPSELALESGLIDERAIPAPLKKPFGWDAYWGAADVHAGPSHSFARNRVALAAKESPAPKPAPSAPELPCDKHPVYSTVPVPLEETCMPLANCCSETVPIAYGRRWTDECVSGATHVEYCPLGTPFGNVGWQATEGWCGKDHSTGAVCPSCTCCCPNVPVGLCNKRPSPTGCPTGMAC